MKKRALKMGAPWTTSCSRRSFAPRSFTFTVVAVPEAVVSNTSAPPAIISAPGVASKPRATAARAPGVRRSSALRNPTISPVAIAMPLLIASYRPLSGSDTTTRFGSARRMSRVASVEPPSTTMCSRSCHCCERTLASASGRYVAALSVGVTRVSFTQRRRRPSGGRRRRDRATRRPRRGTRPDTTARGDPTSTPPRARGHAR